MITSKPSYSPDRPARADGAPEGVQVAQLKEWSQELDKDPALRLARLVVPKCDPLENLLRPSPARHARVFNLQLKGTDGKGAYPSPRAKQGSSGRCWILAANNVLRYPMVKKLNLGDFQLSAQYLYFYDKLEKANWYLEQVMQTKDEPLESRLMTHLNANPMADGAHWHMAINLFEKYGIIPQSHCPDTFSATDSAKLVRLLTTRVRAYALQLRETPDKKLKADYMREIYNMLAITLGTPPHPDQKLNWEYADRDNQCRSWTGTPLDFYAQFGKEPGESFCLTNDPRNEYDRLYTVERLGNVVGGRPAQHVNAPIEALEDAVITSIKADTPVMFACDVFQFSSRSLGILDIDLYDIQTAYGPQSRLSKADRIRMGESRITHGMVITAVHLDESGRPVRCKVENSWSEDVGDKGWFLMTAEWFRENVYQVMVRVIWRRSGGSRFWNRRR